MCTEMLMNDRVKEGVAILISGMWCRAMVKFVCASTRIPTVKFKFDKVKVFVAETYGSSEGSDGEV